MDGSRFDALSRSFARGHSRRVLTRVLSGLAVSGTLARFGLTETAAKGTHHPQHGQAQGKKKPCPPCKQRKKGKCKALLPDGSACAGGTCQGGACLPTVSPPPPGCTPNCVERTCGPDGCGGSCGSCASTACREGGTCDPATGTCTGFAKPDGTLCNDLNLCTRTDICQLGTCVGTNPVVCTAKDQCHVAGTCDPQTGLCSNPPKPDGTPCGDGSLACTRGKTCQAGVCMTRCGPNCVCLNLIAGGTRCSGAHSCVFGDPFCTSSATCRAREVCATGITQPLGTTSQGCGAQIGTGVCWFVTPCP